MDVDRDVSSDRGGENAVHHPDCVNADDEHIRCFTLDGEYVERGPGLRPRCAGRMEAAHGLTYMVDGVCPVCGDECSHPSFNGIDQSDGPDKVWECAGCGQFFRWEHVANGFGRHVLATPLSARPTTEETGK